MKRASRGTCLYVYLGLEMVKRQRGMARKDKPIGNCLGISIKCHNIGRNIRKLAILPIFRRE